MPMLTTSELPPMPSGEAEAEAETGTEYTQPPATTTVAEDLQPGGVGSGVPTQPPSFNAHSNMRLNELRTLATKSGIQGASTMKKGALVEALRSNSNSNSNRHNVDISGTAANILESDNGFSPFSQSVGVVSSSSDLAPVPSE